ncbi:MAG: LysR family transcriptional regulator, partial [Acidimicrobiales bacterium]
MPLPEPCPELGALDLLVSVGELGSISAAATAHGVTQPAASMRLRTLERVLRLQLLERSTAGSRLTPAGAATAEWAGSVLHAMRSLLAGAASLRSGRASEVHVAASLTVAEYLFPRWLEQLTSVLPDVGVSLTMGNTERVAALVGRGEVELGFIEGARPPGRLRSRAVADDELVVVVGSGHPWARRRRPVTPQRLAATPLVLREVGSGTREVLARALGRVGLAPTPAVVMGSTTAIKAAVVGGAGPAVVSQAAVRAELRSGQLVAVPCEGLDLRRAIRAVWAPE